MNVQLRLPNQQHQTETYHLHHTEERPISRGAPPHSRIVYAAAHVVCDPLASNSPADSPALDWEATLAFRHHLWSLGLRIAEAMDTAQRGMGLNWQAAQELIRRSVREAQAVSAGIACGAGTDHLIPNPSIDVDVVQDAYEEQCEFVEAHGGQIILMASRALAASAKSPDDYRRVYGAILRQTARPVILHWLGEAFDPALAGYWGSNNLAEATDICLSIIREHRDKVDGIKISLLDAGHEVAMRRCLPHGVRMYTGDDFHYDELILGDEHGSSDALLGVFDPLAEMAAEAVRSLDRGDPDSFRQCLSPTVPFSRHLFEKPTYFYKTGIVFLAYLNGHQTHFRMVGTQEGCRSIVHLSTLFQWADRIGLFHNPELAVARMRHILALSGVEA